MCERQDKSEITQEQDQGQDKSDITQEQEQDRRGAAHPFAGVRRSWGGRLLACASPLSARQFEGDVSQEADEPVCGQFARAVWQIRTSRVRRSGSPG